MEKRQVVYYYDDGGDWWWSPAGQTTRWVVFGAIVFLIVLYGVVGYWHAKKRIRQGLPPLAYHRWLLSRRDRARFDPRYRDRYQRWPREDPYGLHAYPPPQYDPNSAPPPQYTPPQGASKVNPAQGGHYAPDEAGPAGAPVPEYTPPAGPPPAVLRPEQTASGSNPYRL